MNDYVIVKHLYKSFHRNKKKSTYLSVIEDLNLVIKKGEFVTFFGPNGSGKTTFLNILSGLLPYNGGKVLINGKNPSESKTAYIFQNFQQTLLPWRKNIDNIAFPLELEGIKKKERHKSVLELEHKLGINIENNLYPYELSTGQQQFVAIARAIINKPQILLMDEPFNSLDFQTRVFMEDKILEIWNKTKSTILFVSHDIDESIYLADKLVFLAKKPTKVANIMNIDLPRPRKQQMMISNDFSRLKKEAVDIFRKAILK